MKYLTEQDIGPSPKQWASMTTNTVFWVHTTILFVLKDCGSVGAAMV